MSMYDITVISIIVACIITLIKEYGGIDFVLNFIKSRISSTKGGELGIAALALLVDICTANNTVAIVMAGPIAKDISEEFGVTPRRSASLLDMFSSMGQGLIPTAHSFWLRQASRDLPPSPSSPTASIRC